MSADVVVLLVRGEDADDRPIYAYVSLMAHRVAAFVAARQSGDFHPADFGVVLASGHGDPPHDVRERIAREWGFKPDDLPDVETMRGKRA